MKRGYTLVELLGVMIILGLILLVSFPIIINQIKKSNEAISESTRILIENSAELYISDNEAEYPINPGATYYVAVETLVNEGLVSKGLKDLDIKDYVKVTVNEDKILAFEIVDEKPEPSFANDSWATIAANVKAGNMSVYNVGDTKEITLIGSGDLGQTLTIRVANNSTSSECNQEGFSQSACGFVVEFADTIITHNMNSTATNVGGWRDSEMRTFVNNDIYNALPEELRNVISDTYVVSGHGYSDSNNLTSIDKLYLLSPEEIWGNSEDASNESYLSYNSAKDQSRQLDYYKNKNVNTSNFSMAVKQYNSINNIWWLRTARSGGNNSFYLVNSSGHWDAANANVTNGIAPAFRIG